MTSKNSLGFDDFTDYTGTLRGDELHFITQAFELLEVNANNAIIKVHIIKKLKEFVDYNKFDWNTDKFETVMLKKGTMVLNHSDGKTYGLPEAVNVRVIRSELQGD